MKKKLFLLFVVLVGLLCPIVSAEIVLTDDNVDSYVGKSIIDTDTIVDIDSKRLNQRPYEVFNYKANGGCVNYVCARHWEKLKITYGVSGSTGNGRDCVSRHIDGKKMTSIQTGITYTIRTYFNDAGANIKANSWVSFETSSKGYEKFGHVVFVEYVKIDENGIKQIYYTENVNAGVLKKATLEKFVGGSLSSWATTYLGTACYEIDDLNNEGNNSYNGIYNIVSALNGEKSAVGVSGDSKKSKANVHLWTRHNGDSQQWELKKSGDYYTIINVRSGKALDVYDASTQSGTNVWQYDVNGTKAQQWSIEDAGNGYVYIKSALGNYLDVSNGKSSNGTNIQTYKGNGTDSQKFKLVPICTHSYSQNATKVATCTTSGTKTYVCTKCNDSYTETILSTGHSYSTNSYGNGVGIEYTCTKCGDNYVSAVIDEGTYSIRTAVVTEHSIDVNDQSLENKANIHIWDVGNQNSQKWKIEKYGKYYTIVNVNSGKALDAAGGDTGYGVSVYQYELNKSDSQLWEFILRNDGYYIKSKLGRYLTRVGINNGGRVALYELNNPQYRIEQLWKLVKTTSNVESSASKNGTPNSTSTITEEVIIERIDELYSLVGGRLFNIDGTKDVCIRSDGTHSCVNCRTSSVVESEWFIDIFGNIDANNFSNSFEGDVDKGLIRHACLGFAHFAEWYIFRESNSSQVTTYNVGTYSYTKENLQKYAKVGDILRLDNNHSVIFISCEPNGMNVLHCNWDSGKPMNKIKKSVISYTYGWDKFTISRAINRDNVVSLDEFASISNGDYLFNNNSLYINVLKDKQAIDSINASTSSVSTFQISKDGNSHKITSKDSSNSFVLNVWTTGTSTDGSEVTLYKDTGNASQRWYFEKYGNGYLIHPADNLTLSLTRNTSTNKLYVNTTTKNNNQIWVLEDVEDYQGTGNLTITFDPMGGTVSPTSKKGEFDTPYGSLPTPTRNGYVFLGWYTVKGGGGNEITSTLYVMRNYDHTLYAHWAVLDDQACTITYNANGGIQPPSPQTVNEGERATISNKKLSRSGYEFLGWSKKASSNKADYTPGQKITINEDITLYAVWKPEDESFVLTIGETKANVFGQIKYNDVAPIIENSRTMLPARFIAENLGADVEWIDSTQCVLITKGNTKIEIFIGNEYAKVNGEKYKLDSPAFLRNSRTYTPVRFICENLGATVEWDDEEWSVKITINKCTICESTNHTEHIASDGWEESLPSFVKNNQDDYVIEKRTEYLYETRETRESDKEYISGWDLYDTDVDESSWSKWQETPVYKSSTREVRTKTQYGYYHYALYFNNVDFGTYPVDLEFYNNTELSDASREEYHEVWLDSELKENGKVTYYNKVTKERVTKMGYKNTHCSPTKMNNLYYLGERTVYQYKDTSYTYYHEKWTEGEWTPKKKSENSNCRLIDTRTVYKYESR